MNIGLLQLGGRDQNGNKDIRTLRPGPDLLTYWAPSFLAGDPVLEQTLWTGLAPG